MTVSAILRPGKSGLKIGKSSKQWTFTKEHIKRCVENVFPEGGEGSISKQNWFGKVVINSQRPKADCFGLCYRELFTFA